MKFGRGSRRSIRYSIFIGVLAGSVFSGSGAFAVEDITSVEQLLGVTAGISYVLKNDLDLSTVEDTDSPTYISDNFSGTVDVEDVLTPATFDGGGFTISGLTKPLFYSIGNLGANTTVFDLNLEAAAGEGVTGQGILANTVSASGSAETFIDNVHVSGAVTGGDSVGGLVGENDGGSISNSSAASTVIGNDFVGGLVGYNNGYITNSSSSGSVDGTNNVGGLAGYSNGDILNSYATGAVTGDDDNIGGLVGHNEDGNISNSYASGAVTSGGGLTGFDDIGGLVGHNEDGNISNSYASGAVTGVNVNDVVGGLAGYNTGEILNSYATGAVTGVDHVGGLVGGNGGDIANSYATGAVTGEDDIGGLVGENTNGSVANSYATGDVTGSGEYIGGLVGWLEEGATISNSYATGVVTGTGTDEEDHGIGGLVGYSSGYISDSHAEGNVNGFADVGGLVGSTGGALVNITNSYATGDVSGVDNIGGLVGLLDVVHTITNSYATGDVTGSGEYIGGLVGDAYGTIEDSYATGDVTGTGVNSVDFHGIGGLIGYLGGFLNNSYATGVVRGFAEIGGLVGSLGAAGPSISNSHATGDVYGEEFVGGLVGTLDSGQSVFNAYATGDVTGYGDYIGGLVGASAGYIQNSYATGDVTGSTYVGGLAGQSFSSFVRNSFATGDVVGSALVNNFIGSVNELSDIDDLSRAFSKSSPDAPSILSVVNTAGTVGAPAFEIVACKNNGLPLLSILDASYANTCTSNPPPASVSAVLASVVQLNPKFNLLESTTLRLFLYLAGDDTIRITVEDFVVLGVTGVNKANLPILLKLLKDVDLFTLDLKTINKNVKIADELLKKKKKK
jgi:hypothetical protein